MSNKKKVFTAVLMPWLKLDEDLKLGKYRFLRWPRNDSEIDTKFNTAIDSIFSMYKYLSGEVESPITIMIDTSRECFCRLNEEERELYIEAVTLLTVALMGENQYFHHGNYVNSSMTEVHFQNFSLGEDWVAFTSRKRDGSTTDMGYRFDEVTITTPTACRTRSGCSSISSTWLNSLGSVLSKSTQLDRLIIEASNLFYQANTDSPSVLTSTEVVALANAFDRLFPNHDGRYKLASKLSSVLDAWQAIIVKNSKRLETKGVEAPKIYTRYKEDIKDWKIIRFWMFELYVLRSDYVHGNDLNRHKWGWAANEHLLLGAYVFPLLVKVLLANERRYKLSDEDKSKIFAIDALLDLPLYYDRETRKNLWRQTIRDKRWDYSFK